MAHDLSINDMRAAQDLIAGRVWRTPLITLPGTRTTGGLNVVIKAENLQLSGSFKIRGATNYIARRCNEGGSAGVIAYSTGNHGRAVATAARLMNVAATVVMSPDASAHKVAAVEEAGAAVLMAPSNSLARRRMAEDIARERDLGLLPPCDDPDVLAGQATVALEILDRCDPAAIFVPVGGGGLLAATAAAVKQLKPSVKIIGVEPECEDDACRSFRTGKRVTLDKASPTIADAVRLLTLGQLTLPLILRYVDDMVTVSEAEIAAATLEAADNAHLVLEPSGALAIAAARSYAAALGPGDAVVAIGSGGNVKLDLFPEFRRIAAGRPLQPRSDQ